VRAASFEIRPATAADAAPACAVLRRSISECCARDHGDDPAILAAWLGNKTPQMVTNWFQSTRNFPLVALEAGEVVGVALLTRAGKLALCYLLPQVRRRGLGDALLERLEQQAALWEIKLLQVHSTNSAAAFFARHGYSACGNVRSPYGLDTVLFWKRLGACAPAPGAPQPRFCRCNQA